MARTPRKNAAKIVKAEETPLPLGLSAIPDIVASASLPDEIKQANADKVASDTPITMDTPITPFTPSDLPVNSSGEKQTFTGNVIDKEETTQERAINTVVFINPTLYRDMRAYEHIEVKFDNVLNVTINAKIVLYEKGITRKTRYVGRCRMENGKVIGLSLKNTKEENDLIALWALRAYEKRNVGMSLLLTGKMDNDGLPEFIEGYNAGKRAKYLPLVTQFAANALARKGIVLDKSKVTTLPHTLAEYTPYED
jgi:hypothetical protein